MLKQRTNKAGDNVGANSPPIPCDSNRNNIVRGPKDKYEQINTITEQLFWQLVSHCH